jgi:hypothetical protein
MSFGNGGSMPRVVSSRVVALYSPEDGRVVHVHTVRVFEGGKPVSREEAESAARSHAGRHGHNVASLKVLHADELPGDFGLYRVDPAAGRMIGGEAPVAGFRRQRRRD